MTTLVQLDKFAAIWFHDQMRRRGFAVEKKFIFWRKRDPLYDMFISRISSGGFLVIDVTIWSPWADQLNGDLGEFPPSSPLIGGYLSENFPKNLHGESMLLIKDGQLLETCLRIVLDLIDKCALPWFSTVHSYETYASYIGRIPGNTTREYRDELKRRIALGFEKEPYP